MSSATGRMRPVISNVGILVKTCHVHKTMMSQHICRRHYLTNIATKPKSLNRTLGGVKICLNTPTQVTTCRHFVPLTNDRHVDETSRLFRQGRLLFCTKVKDEESKMTEEEKQLYKAIQSEMESSIEDEIDHNFKTIQLTPKKKKMKKSEKYKEKMVENLNFPNVTVYSCGRLDLDSLKQEFENDDLYMVCQLPPEFTKEVLMVRSKSKKQDGTYTDAFFLRSFGVACWAMNQHQGEKLVMRAIQSYQRNINNYSTSYQDIIDNREVFRTVQSETIRRIKDRIYLPSVTDVSLLDDKTSLDMDLKKCTFSKALLQSVTLGQFEEMLSDFIENRGLEKRTEELKRGHGSNMNSKTVYTGFGEISYIRYQVNLSDLFDEDPDEFWEYDDLQGLYTDMVTYLSIPKRIREVNKNLDYCEALIKLFNDRLTDKHHVNLERIIIILIFIEILIELIRYFPYLKGLTTENISTQEEKAS